MGQPSAPPSASSGDVRGAQRGMARAKAAGVAPARTWHPLEAEEFLLVLAWDRTFADLPAVTENENPLIEYYERWHRAHSLVNAEITGRSVDAIEGPLDQPGRWQVLLEEGETPELAYLIILLGHMQQHTGAPAVGATPAEASPTRRANGGGK